jgi:proteasome lid subunit RPN8/RPN11
VARDTQELTFDRIFQISSAALDAIIVHARAAHPLECCGMLVGTGVNVEDAVPARNLAATPNRFLVDPVDHIAARRAARASGREVVGFYHSHPHSRAEPSVTDVAEATYPEAVHLIVSLAGGDPQARLFRIDANGVTELRFARVG